MTRPELIRTLKRVGWVGLIFLSAALVISAIERKDTSLAASVDIDIEPLPDSTWLINDEDIFTSIQRSFGFQMEGLPLSALDVGRLERVLNEDPFILEADVFVDAKNTLHIGIEQREPTLRIIDKNGLNYYLDGSGYKMPLSKHFSARVLVATGNIPPHVPDFLDRKKHVLKDLFQLKDLILEDDFFNALVEQIYVSNRNNYILIPKIGKQKIILGSMSDIENKLARLKTFYEEAVPYEGWRKYKTINLSFNDQVVCKK